MLAAVLCLGSLARLACAHILGHVAILPHPEGEATHQRPCLGPPDVPALWHLRRTCVCRSPPAGVQSSSAAPWPQRYNRQHSTRNVPGEGVHLG